MSAAIVILRPAPGPLWKMIGRSKIDLASASSALDRIRLSQTWRLASTPQKQFRRERKPGEKRHAPIGYFVVEHHVARRCDCADRDRRRAANDSERPGSDRAAYDRQAGLLLRRRHHRHKPRRLP